MSKSRIFLLILIILLVITAAAFLIYQFVYKKTTADTVVDLCTGDCFKIITWGNNSTEFQKKLNPTDYRSGCSSTPQECITASASEINSGDISNPAEYLSINKDPNNAANYALQYSQLSLQNPWLKEIGYDDFVSTYNGWVTAQVDYRATLNSMIDSTKQANPDLKFGITMYEDQLNHALISDEELPAATRARVDNVHLFIHYRENGLNYREYVNQAKEKFPNAKIIAGAYNYDRIDYVPCGQVAYSRPIADNLKCTADQELSLFQQTLQIQADMLQSKEIAAIEFYPGFYDDQTVWAGFDNSNICSPNRKDECIQNTIKLEQAALTVLSKYREVGSSQDSSTDQASGSATTTNQDQNTTSNQIETTNTESAPTISSSQSQNQTSSEGQVNGAESEQNLTEAGPNDNKNLFIAFYLALIITTTIALVRNFKNSDYPY